MRTMRDIEQVVCAYFSQLFSTQGVSNDFAMCSVRPSVDDCMNITLLWDFLCEEIKVVVFQM